MIRSASLCDKCDAPTANHENDCGQILCKICEENAAERAWERRCTDYDAASYLEQQIQALR